MKIISAATLRLIDGISPGIVTDPSGRGNYCLLMPCRCVAAAEGVTENTTTGTSPVQSKAA